LGRKEKETKMKDLLLRTQEQLEKQQLAQMTRKLQEEETQRLKEQEEEASSQKSAHNRSLLLL
jgi:hypothetical protein